MAATDDPAHFTLGQSVTLRYYELNELLGALIVFGIPLACAMLSLIVWYLVSPAAVESGPSLLSAGIAFVAGFFIVKIIDRTFRTAYPSQIVATDDVASVTSLPVTENKRDG
jgi:positive regulator of sigma E activity